MSSLHHWKDLEMQMFKMGSHDPFGYLKHKLWTKRTVGNHYQFDSQTLKVKNRRNLIAFKLLVRYH